LAQSSLSGERMIIAVWHGSFFARNKQQQKIISDQNGAGFSGILSAAI